MADNTHITILGLGNVIMGDEGFGCHFVRWFEPRHRFPPTVEIVEGGTLGYVLLDVLARSRTVIVIDCIKLDDAPGSIYRFTHTEFTAKMPPPTTAHEVKFTDVLFKAELMGELPAMVFLCIVPQAYQDMDLNLTPVMQARLPDMERLVLAELATLGIIPPRSPDA